MLYLRYCIYYIIRATNALLEFQRLPEPFAIDGVAPLYDAHSAQRFQYDLCSFVFCILKQKLTQHHIFGLHQIHHWRKK